MNKSNTRRGFTQNVVICPPCGESVAVATKEGQNRKKALWPLLPRLTAVLPPQGREMSSAFTLIELLVVVLIIGILAAVAVPQYQKAVDKATLLCVMPVLKTLTDAQKATALARGGFTNGVYFTFDDLDVDIKVDDENCKRSDICHFKCNGKSFGIVLRNNETWAGFYFWANSLERFRYIGGNGPHYMLECASARCKRVAKAFGGQPTQGSTSIYTW